MSLNENEKIIEILQNSKTIAVVGCSREPEKDSYRVAKYLQEQGFKIIPVNPFAEEILGEKCYKSLLEIPERIQKEIEIVDIFRPSKDVPQIVEQAVEMKTKCGKPEVIWMQLGIMNESAAEKAEEAGIEVVANKCMMIEHRKIAFMYTVHTSKTFDDAVSSVEKKVSEIGWRVLHIHDAQKILAEKEIQIEPLKIIEICSAKYSSQMLQKDVKISLCMPCKINVYSLNGKTFISTLRASMLEKVFPNVDFGDIPKEIDDFLVRIVEEAR